MTKKELFTELSKIEGVEPKNSHQLVTRCVLCGDSLTNPNKKRLGIKIDCDNLEEPVLYQCFNCGQTGVVTSDMIKEIGCDDPIVLRGLREVNGRAFKSEGNTKVNKYKNIKELKVELPLLTKNPIYLQKAQYLLDRVGRCGITVKDFQKLRIVWSLKDFLYVNGIRQRNQHTDSLDANYIGFLSANNEYIIFRDITNRQKLRYVKYNIFGVYDNSNAFYTIKNRINPITQQDLHIIVAEGPFDIISILYNVFDGDDADKIFCAVCNGQYKNTLSYYMNKGLVGRNIFIDVYRDNDNDKVMDYHKLKTQMKPYTKNFRVYYNQLSKDFGVPKDKIDIDVFYI